MNDLIGRTLKGKYLITAPLGEGAMGIVYRGIDTETQRDVAIKVMHPALMREPGMLTRFRREATAMHRVRHPNAVEVFAHGVDQGIVFLAMEFVAGSDLGSRLARERRLPVDRAVSIVSQVCGALAVAHALGLVHRDIKPENIMLGGPLGETAKLIDFGVAKSGVYLDDGDAGSEAIEEDGRPIDDSIPEDLDLGPGLDLTCAGTLVGSPGYMAPEQWRSRNVDGRTDVFACGVLLYQLVTGRLPFEDENPMVVAERQLTEQPEPPHVLNPAVSPSLSAIILKALQPAPEARFQTAAQMGAALRAQTVEHFIASTIVASTLALDATIPLQVASPIQLDLAASLDRTLPLPDDDSSEPLARTLALPEIDPTVPRPVAGSLARSVSRNGRLTPVPPVSLARRSSAPPLVVHAPARVPLRALLGIAAAFLALGVVLGMLLFFPGVRH